MHKKLPLDAASSWDAFSLGAGEAVCCPSLERNRWRPWLARMPRALESEAALEIRHSSLLSTGRKTYQLAGPEGRSLVVKRYPGAWWEKLAFPDGSKPACSPWDAFRCNLALSLRGIPVPQPLAFVEQNQNTPDAVSYAITGLLEGCQPLMNFAFEHLCRRACTADVTRWMETVVATIVNLHRAGYSHGDLHHHNILIRSHDTGTPIQVYLTDFDACLANTETIPDRAQVLDLASLAASLYQVVPDRLLWKALARYFKGLSLAPELRQRCLETLREGYRSFLNCYIGRFDCVENFYFALAEKALEEIKPTP
jgi:tRNA A-37 threonylcarbamoyl transferase component Bud32